MSALPDGVCFLLAAAGLRGASPKRRLPGGWDCTDEPPAGLQSPPGAAVFSQPRHSGAVRKLGPSQSADPGFLPQVIGLLVMLGVAAVTVLFSCLQSSGLLDLARTTLRWRPSLLAMAPFVVPSRFSGRPVVSGGPAVSQSSV